MESTAQPATGASPARETVESLDQLPDKVILKVMKNFTAEDLLRCRLLCKKFGRLALDPAVWRGVSVGEASCPVFRLAPCLSFLRVDVQQLGHCKHLRTTNCAVRELELKFGDGDGVDLKQLIESIQRQESLGRLKELEVEVDFLQMKSRVLAALLKAVAFVAGLERLRVYGDSDMHKGPALGAAYAVRSPLPSTLKEFRFMACARLDNFVNFVLGAHAATLEKIFLMGPMCTPETARLIGGMPKLQDLDSYLLPGMEAVAACESLSILHLELDFPNHATQLGGVTLLREVHHVTDITLDTYFAEDSAQLDVYALMILALGSSRQSQVKKLRLRPGSYVSGEAGKRSYQRIFGAVTDVLPKLAALQELSVTLDLPDEVLQAITPETAPALRRIGLVPSMCVHAWVHRGVVSKFLSANPSLHVALPHKSNPCTCQVCTEDCHQDLRKAKRGHLWRMYLCTHLEDDCDSPEYHDPVTVQV
ncbi:uncharacterized protein LOC127750277 isoform X2 [Frankliniella occidentalis]|uniref:Uncharacterized protein LOC127750277 isoform X2 n=1 Tax=Frankliniella occidentalis TaxID=133901 RepID=A0A9C6XQC6_FRAOC|nr:uncharacterized protein LOC127750277 isoform X2 [Frankliniella occidentalis]